MVAGGLSDGDPTAPAAVGSCTQRQLEGQQRISSDQGWMIIKRQKVNGVTGAARQGQPKPDGAQGWPDRRHSEDAGAAAPTSKHNPANPALHHSQSQPAPPWMSPTRTLDLGPIAGALQSLLLPRSTSSATPP